MIKNGVNSTTVWKPSIIQKGEKQTRTKQTDKQIIFLYMSGCAECSNQVFTLTLILIHNSAQIINRGVGINQQNKSQQFKKQFSAGSFPQYNNSLQQSAE